MRRSFECVLISTLLLTGLSVGGCRRPDDDGSSASGATSPASVGAGEARAEATEIFNMRCTPCHGPRGGGDGPASSGLTPRPRDLGDASWQASVGDDHLATIIQMGGAAVGKSASMPANPDLMAKPAVVTALVAHVRALRR